MSKATHKTRCLSYLQEHKTITSLDAIRDLGNTRLASTICRLRKDGHSILSSTVEVDNRWGTKSQVSKYTYYKPSVLSTDWKDEVLKRSGRPLTSFFGNLRRK
jgi:hypothetical protein